MPNVADDFNRADGALGSNWTNMTVATTAPTFDATISVVSTQAKSNGGGGGNNGGAYWTANTFAPDQFSEVQIAVMPGVAAWIGALVRANPTSHYLVIAYNNGGIPEIDLYKMVASSWALITGAAVGTFTAGDVLRLEAQGTTLRVKLNGATRITTTDGAVASGSPGIATAGTVTMDNWQGGDGQGVAAQQLLPLSVSAQLRG